MEWVINAMPLPLYPRERPGTHFIGDWVGPRAGLDECGKSLLHRDSIPGPPSPLRVVILSELYGFTHSFHQMPVQRQHYANSFLIHHSLTT
jgi:hypothetical protein